MRTMIFGKYTLSARAESNKTVTRCGCVESTDTSALRSAEINRKKHPPHLSVQGMHYIKFLRSFLFFSALCRASDSLAYLEHRDSGDRETCGNEQLIELECAGRDVNLLYYLETFLFAAAR